MAQAGGAQDALEVSWTEGIVVTAQKRPELMQDVPVSVTSINAPLLVETNRLLVKEYFDKIPGFNVMPGGPQANQLLAIRGITTGSGNPTVAVMIDDVPFCTSTFLGGGNVIPDLDPGELKRIEVLRGPQGTLYGTSSLGGLLKFVTLDPSTDRASGYIRGGINGVTNGAGAGYSVRAAGNLPVSDKLAIRAGGLVRREPGYVDNPVRHIRGLNDQRATGGQVSGLWMPEPGISLKLTALFQELKAGGTNHIDVVAGLGDLQQNHLPGSGAYDRKIQAYIAALDIQRGLLDLKSVTGYTVNQFTDVTDTSFGPRSVAVRTAFGVGGAAMDSSNRMEKLTQEVRMSLPVTTGVEWLIGGFYTRESAALRQTTLAQDSTTGVIVGTAVVADFPSTYQEFAGFTNVTFQASDRLDVQLGARDSRIKQTSRQTVTGPLTAFFTGGLSSPAVFPEVRSSSDAFTYLVTPRLRASTETMLYARLASGYRAGGPNRSPGGIVPAQYEPDRTQSYEVGMKATFLSGRLAVDASAYHIKWKDIQLQATNPATTIVYLFNGARAKSDGVEVAVEARPSRGTTLAGWVAWNDAILADPIRVGAFAESGERLPMSARFSGHLSFEQNFLLAHGWTGSAGIEVSHVGDRKGFFRQTATAARQEYPAYTTTNLRAGIRAGSWTGTLFVTNATDERGKLGGGIGNVIPFAFVEITPRTYGLSFAYTF